MKSNDEPLDFGKTDEILEQLNSGLDQIRTGLDSAHIDVESKEEIQVKADSLKSRFGEKLKDIKEIQKEVNNLEVQLIEEEIDAAQKSLDGITSAEDLETANNNDEILKQLNSDLDQIQAYLDSAQIDAESKESLREKIDSLKNNIAKELENNQRFRIVFQQIQEFEKRISDVQENLDRIVPAKDLEAANDNDKNLKLLSLVLDQIQTKLDSTQIDPVSKKSFQEKIDSLKICIGEKQKTNDQFRELKERIDAAQETLDGIVPAEDLETANNNDEVLKQLNSDLDQIQADLDSAQIDAESKRSLQEKIDSLKNDIGKELENNQRCRIVFQLIRDFEERINNVQKTLDGMVPAKDLVTVGENDEILKQLNSDLDQIQTDLDSAQIDAELKSLREKIDSLKDSIEEKQRSNEQFREFDKRIGDAKAEYQVVVIEKDLDTVRASDDILKQLIVDVQDIRSDLEFAQIDAESKESLHNDIDSLEKDIEAKQKINRQYGQMQNIEERYNDNKEKFDRIELAKTLEAVNKNAVILKELKADSEKIKSDLDSIQIDT